MSEFKTGSNKAAIMQIRPGDAFLDPRQHTFAGEAILIVTSIDSIGRNGGYIDRIIRFDKCIPTDDTYSELTRIDKGSMWAGLIRSSKFIGPMPPVRNEQGKLIDYSHLK